MLRLQEDRKIKKTFTKQDVNPQPLDDRYSLWITDTASGSQIQPLDHRYSLWITETAAARYLILIPNGKLRVKQQAASCVPDPRMGVDDFNTK